MKDDVERLERKIDLVIHLLTKKKRGHRGGRRVKNKHTRRRERKIVRWEDDRHKHYRSRSHSRSRSTIHSPPRIHQPPQVPETPRPAQPSQDQTKSAPKRSHPSDKRESPKEKETTKRKKGIESVETIQPGTTSKDLAGGGAPRMEGTYKPERRATPPIDLVIWKKEPEVATKTKSSKPRPKKQNPPKAPSTTRTQPKQNPPKVPSTTKTQPKQNPPQAPPTNRTHAKQNPPKAPSTTRPQPKQNQQAPQARATTQLQDELLLELEVSESEFDELA